MLSKNLIPLFVLLLISCGQNDTKQKELELKERELALKEKELASKENASSSKIPSDSLKTNALTKEIPIINPLKIQLGDIVSIFPIIELSDKVRADEMNSYI